MTLPSSGDITTTAIAAEIGGFPFDIPSTAIRNLTGRAAGNITMPADFYGQTGGGNCVKGTTPAQTTTSGGVATFAAVTFGTPTPWNRRIFLCVHWGCGTSAVETTISSATIGGISAALHANYGEGGTSTLANYGAAIISATVPTGTSGTVVITFSNATVRTVLITPYWVYGLVSGTASDVGVAFDEWDTPATGSAGVSLTRPADDLSFFAATHNTAGTLFNLSTTIITEQQEANFTPAGVDAGRYSNGFRRGLGAGTSTPTTSTASAATSNSRIRMVCASFQCR